MFKEATTYYKITPVVENGKFGKVKIYVKKVSEKFAIADRYFKDLYSEQTFHTEVRIPIDHSFMYKQAFNEENTQKDIRRWLRVRV